MSSGGSPLPGRPNMPGLGAGKPRDQPGASPGKCRIARYGHPGNGITISRGTERISPQPEGSFFTAGGDADMLGGEGFLMTDDNKRNIVYFEGETMRGLYEAIDTWQETERKRLASLSVQVCDGKYCAIAVTNPTEVVIVHGREEYQATVTDDGQLEIVICHGNEAGQATVDKEGNLWVLDD